MTTSEPTGSPSQVAIHQRPPWRRPSARAPASSQPAKSETCPSAINCPSTPTAPTAGLEAECGERGGANYDDDDDATQTLPHPTPVWEIKCRISAVWGGEFSLSISSRYFSHRALSWALYSNACPVPALLRVQDFRRSNSHNSRRGGKSRD